MNYKSIITIIASAGIGFAAGWFVKKYLDDKEIKRIIDYYENEEAEAVKEEPTEETPTPKSPVDLETAHKVMQKYKGEVSTEVPKKVIVTEEDRHPVDSNEDVNSGEEEPYFITAEQYDDDDMKEWDKGEYTYYRGKSELRPHGVMADEIVGCIVADPKYDTGKGLADWDEFFATHAEGCVFVRNPYLGCDFMVTCTEDYINEEMYEGIPIDHEGGEK